MSGLSARFKYGAAAKIVCVSQAIAGIQTAGRGRLGRTWTAPARSALLCSVLLHWKNSIEAAPLAALATGVALQRVTGSLGVRTRLKWPNDLIVEGQTGQLPTYRKMAGVLAELISTGPGSKDLAVVIGFGFNLHRPEDLAGDGATLGGTAEGVPETEKGVDQSAGSAGSEWTRTATWLSDHLSAQEAELLRFDDVVSSVLTELQISLQLLDDSAAGFITAYRNVCATLGQRVRVDLPAGSVQGVAQAIDPQGRLMIALEDSDQPLLTVNAGEVVHLRPT